MMATYDGISVNENTVGRSGSWQDSRLLELAQAKRSSPRFLHCRARISRSNLSVPANWVVDGPYCDLRHEVGSSAALLDIYTNVFETHFSIGIGKLWIRLRNRWDYDFKGCW